MRWLESCLIPSVRFGVDAFIDYKLFFFAFQKDKNLIHQRTCSTINYQFLPRNCALKQILDIQLLVKVSSEKKHDFSGVLKQIFLAVNSSKGVLEPVSARHRFFIGQQSVCLHWRIVWKVFGLSWRALRAAIINGQIGSARWFLSEWTGAVSAWSKCVGLLNYDHVPKIGRAGRR